MSISKKTKEFVRNRAEYACEFCGVTESDTRGRLTVDHYQPRTKGGSDELDNLLYCCFSCNLFKHDYYPAALAETPLWNPRHESFSTHFLELESGLLHPLTPVGFFTLDRLRLNRPALVANRLQKRQMLIEHQLLNRYRELNDMLHQINLLLNDRLMEQKQLLLEQQKLMKLLLGRLGNFK
jgi:hypothetical protein